MTYIITTEICGNKYYLQELDAWPKYIWNGLIQNAKQFNSVYNANYVRRIWASHSKTKPIIEQLNTSHK